MAAAVELDGPVFLSVPSMLPEASSCPVGLTNPSPLGSHPLHHREVVTLL
jgi:hypothetical protein